MITDSTARTPGIPEDNIPTLSALDRGAPLDCGQAAHFLNLSESYVRKAVSGNRIPHLKIGSRVLFRRDALDAWIDSHAVATNAEISRRAEGIAGTYIVTRPRARKSTIRHTLTNKGGI